MDFAAANRSVGGQVNVLTLKEHASDLEGSECPYIGTASIQLGNQVMLVMPSALGISILIPGDDAQSNGSCSHPRQ